ncbi:uncharacterized protein LOC144453670 [Glandiceps talaboti]
MLRIGGTSSIVLAEKPPRPAQRKEKGGMLYVAKRNVTVGKEYPNINARLRRIPTKANVPLDNNTDKAAVKKVVLNNSKTVACRIEKKSSEKENVCIKMATGATKCTTRLEKTIESVPMEMEIDEHNDPNEFTEYCTKIHKYLKLHESKSCHGGDYLTASNNPCSNDNRSVLLDWLISVQCHLRLNDETLHLTVCMFDSFMSVSPISLEKLQLLGITCLLIAAKIEERYAPEIDMLCFLTDYTYSKKEVIRMEILVLKALKFDLFYPTCVNFYDLYVEAATEFVQNYNDKILIENAAKYIMDLSICSPYVLNFPPSLRAAAALSLARKIVMKDEKSAVWTTSMVHATGYTDSELLVCMHIYATLLTRSSCAKQQAAKVKYNSVSRYQAISSLPLANSLVVKRLVQYPTATKV